MASLMLLLSAAGLTQAYTQVNAASPFMFKNIDPIVVPGQYKSHLHSFFGSDAVTLNTNSSAELQSGCTNAENPNDLSVYWVPTALYTTDGGATYSPMPVMRFSAYYNLGETEAEVAIPQDLKLVAGNSSATREADMDADAKAAWFCEGSDTSFDANGFPSSTCPTHLQQLLYFPSCVNPSTLETAYKIGGRTCPDGMKSMPQLRFSIRYDLRKVLPDGWSGTAPFKLSCGNAYCSHGDFINGWTKEAAENMLETTKDKRKFGGVDGEMGSYKAGTKCNATDADPNNGTSDYAKSVKMLQKRDLAGWMRSRVARGV